MSKMHQKYVWRPPGHAGGANAPPDHLAAMGDLRLRGKRDGQGGEEAYF